MGKKLGISNEAMSVKDYVGRLLGKSVIALKTLGRLLGKKVSLIMPPCQNVVQLRLNGWSRSSKRKNKEIIFHLPFHFSYSFFTFVC